MDINSLTIGEAKALACMFQSPCVDNGAWEIGGKYLIRTVTMIDTGKLVAITQQELVLEDGCAQESGVQ